MVAPNNNSNNPPSTPLANSVHETNHAADYSTRILQALTNATQLLLRSNTWETVTNDVLALIGQAVDVAKVTVFENISATGDDVLAAPRFFWAIEEHKAALKNLMEQQNAVFSHHQHGLQRWQNILQTGEPVYGAIDDFPLAEQDFLRIQNTTCVALIPIFVKGRWWGSLGMEETRFARHWTVQDIDMLRAIASYFGTVIESKMAEAALRSSEARYRYLVDTARDLIWSTDTEGRWRFLNPAASEIFGYSLNDMLGRSVLDFIPSSHHYLGKKLLRELATGQQIGQHELFFKRADNKIITLIFNAIPSYTEQGDLTHFTGTATDITPLKNTEQALRESEQRFQIVARATNDAIWDWDLITNQVWMNTGAELMFGYSSEEIGPVAKWWLDNTHPVDKKRILDDIHQLTQRGHNFWSAEYRFRYGNGSYAIVFDRGYIIYDDNKKAIRMIGSMQDITEQKRNEKHLRDSRERLRNLATRLQQVREEEREMIARELHDEFAQILTALKLDLQWIQKRIPAEQTTLLERTDAMGEMIESTMERVWRVATELRPKLLDDLGLSAAIKWQLQQFSERTGCDYSSHVDIDEAGLERGIQLAVFRIFQESLTNIVRHAHANNVFVRLTLVADEVTLEIQDNGKGISEEKIYHVESLGLIGMRERAGVFGGRVIIQPLADRGTQITLQIPKRITQFPAID
ncbi:MAG: PAS domain S-box protein [Gammaproteobacteria bacterium]|nr:PAS domain S-box protein [Gammaproteobacteria bacterium]